jgi:hypothetical protein
VKTKAQLLVANILPDKLHRHAVRRGEGQVLCRCGRGLFVLVKPDAVIVFGKDMVGRDGTGSIVVRCVACGKSDLRP